MGQLVSCLIFADLVMIKIVGSKSSNKINFREFVDFFYKTD